MQEPVKEHFSKKKHEDVCHILDGLNRDGKAMTMVDDYVYFISKWGFENTVSIIRSDLVKNEGIKFRFKHYHGIWI